MKANTPRASTLIGPDGATSAPGVVFTVAAPARDDNYSAASCRDPDGRLYVVVAIDDPGDVDTDADSIDGSRTMRAIRAALKTERGR